ncbi:MAG TPA: Asp-tRNA(Asn)/Glu-tRNA(Gln) amidotransferase subunit GatC [Thermoanaerobaculia bacterium]|nr:Asp-tRNA(Asn)/Glu-tRNA(Gln) amidotransferase subunit GatC [Thermoanaerobaculia bacterium]
MPSNPSIVTPDVVRRIAELARLRLPESELPRWTEQLSRIVGHIDLLTQIPEEAFGTPPPEPPTPLRLDAPEPGHGDDALRANAPRELHGYGAVPRVVGSGG